MTKTSERFLLAKDQSPTKDLRETNMRIEEVIPQIGITQTRKELSPANRTGGKFQCLKQQI